MAPGATVAPFYRAIAASNVAYDQRLFIVLEGASATYPGFDLIDATPNSKLAEPAPLLHAVFERSQGSESTRTKSDPVPYEQRPTTPILHPPMHPTGRDGRPAPAAN